MSLPTVVVECGWSETHAKLYNDRDLWLLGGRGSMQLVIIVEWSKSDRSKVKGEIELFGLDETGQVSCLQRQVRETWLAMLSLFQ